MHTSRLPETTATPPIDSSRGSSRSSACPPPGRSRGGKSSCVMADASALGRSRHIGFTTVSRAICSRSSGSTIRLAVPSNGKRSAVEIMLRPSPSPPPPHVSVAAGQAIPRTCDCFDAESARRTTGKPWRSRHLAACGYWPEARRIARRTSRPPRFRARSKDNSSSVSHLPSHRRRRPSTRYRRFPRRRSAPKRQSSVDRYDSGHSPVTRVAPPRYPLAPARSACPCRGTWSLRW